jgi:hypothetical protein
MKRAAVLLLACTPTLGGDDPSDSGASSSRWAPSAENASFGDECTSSASCCAADAAPHECALTCTMLNSKLSSCSAACDTAADCSAFARPGEELQCIQVATPRDTARQEDVSYAGAAVGAALVGVLAFGCCALHREKDAARSKKLGVACAVVAAAVVVVVNRASWLGGADVAAEAAPNGSLPHSDILADAINGTEPARRRFCAPNSLLWVVGVSMTLAGSVSITFGTQLQKLAFNWQEQAWLEAVATAEAAAVAAGTSGGHEPAPRKPWFKLPMWWLGYVFLAIGAISDFAAVGFAAQSLLAPLAASSLIINIVQAPCMLGEVPTAFDMLATLVICAGCTVSVSFADHTTRTYSLEDMLVHSMQPLFCTYIVSLLGLMLFASSRIRQAERDVQLVPLPRMRAGEAEPAGPRAGQPEEEGDEEQGGKHAPLPQEEEEEEGASFVLVEQEGCSEDEDQDEDAQEEVELDAVERSRMVGSNTYAVYYAVLAGQCGGLTMLFAKMLFEIVRATGCYSSLQSIDTIPYLSIMSIASIVSIMSTDIGQYYQLWTLAGILFSLMCSTMCATQIKTLVQVGGLGVGWLTLAFATLTALLAACMVKQLQYLNAGFRLFDLLLIQPIYQASWITGTALNGLLFFQEYVDFTYTQWIMVSAVTIPVKIHCQPSLLSLPLPLRHAGCADTSLPSASAPLGSFRSV